MIKVAIIGAGFSGISAATCLAHAGYDVTVFEKNSTPGGRARQLKIDGFTFDMGPSWYWMPDVFDEYFKLFGRKTEEYYSLKRLDPSYRVYFGAPVPGLQSPATGNRRPATGNQPTDYIDIPVNATAQIELFDRIEPGAGLRLKQFLAEAKEKYNIALRDFIVKPGLSWMEFADPGLIMSAMKLHIFQSMHAYVRKFFKDPRLIKILEFPVLFLGAAPKDTPALYSLMNHADLTLGTWYPEGGMYSVVRGMVKLAEEYKVKFKYDSPVENFKIKGDTIAGVQSRSEFFQFDAVIAAADYHHIEQNILPKEYRMYDEKYWDNRVLAPSSLLFYVGLDKKVEGLLHHTLFFDADFEKHAREIYQEPRWPSDPQFYVSCATKSDPAAAPAGGEALVILVPVAPGLEDTDVIRERYFDVVLRRLERLIGQSLRDSIVVKRSYSINDFTFDYNAYKGNAYGLANTLWQTATLKPSIINKKLKNLFYCGQLTVPGPGVPPAIISGQIVAKEVIRRSEGKKSL